MRADAIQKAMRPHGFSLAWSERSPVRALWFGRRRAGPWRDFYCFELHAGRNTFALSFGVEHDAIRESALAIAEQIAPEALSKASILRFEERPCLCTFQVPTGGAPDSTTFTFSRTEIDDELLASMDAALFDNVDSEPAYLDFLANRGGVFEWIRSATAFRLLYVGLLYRHLGRTASEWRDACEQVPRKPLESHVLLRERKMNADDFIEACVSRIWTEQGA